MKEVRLYIPVVLFVILYKVIQMKLAVEQYFSVVLFVMLYKVFLAFESVTMWIKPQSVRTIHVIAVDQYILVHMVNFLC